MAEPYRRVAGSVLSRERPREVVTWEEQSRNGVLFRCPCGHRLVRVEAPPHAITFDRDRLTVDPSCGFPGDAERPKNWCHFTVTDGVAKMHDDAQCPGAVNG